MLLGSAPRFLILLFVQLAASTTVSLTNESPAITPDELISKAQLDFPPESFPRLTIPPLDVHSNAMKLNSSRRLVLTLEYPTTCPPSLIPIAPLMLPPGSVPRSFNPPLLVQ